MNFIFEDTKTEAPLPIAFMDNEGELWFRTNDADDIKDNVVNIMTKRGDILDNMTMDDFINALNHDKSYAVRAAKTFYVGDTVTIQF